MAQDRLGEVMAKLREDQYLMNKLNAVLAEVYAKSELLPDQTVLTPSEKAQLVVRIAGDLVVSREFNRRKEVRHGTR